MEELSKTDRFIAKMKEDCSNGLLEEEFNPYVDWLLDRTSEIDKKRMYEMCDLASERMEQLCVVHPKAFSILPTLIDDNPWQIYEGFGKDKYLYSYYEQIESSLTDMIMFS
jgi:hypothetical protein